MRGCVCVCTRVCVYSQRAQLGERRQRVGAQLRDQVALQVAVDKRAS